MIRGDGERLRGGSPKPSEWAGNAGARTEGHGGAVGGVAMLGSGPGWPRPSRTSPFASGTALLLAPAFPLWWPIPQGGSPARGLRAAGHASLSGPRPRWRSPGGLGPHWPLNPPTSRPRCLALVVAVAMISWWPVALWGRAASRWPRSHLARRLLGAPVSSRVGQPGGCGLAKPRTRACPRRPPPLTRHPLWGRRRRWHPGPPPENPRCSS